jgi:DNA-binding NarL/FixJ family response regulator
LGAGLRLLYGLSSARDEEAIFEPGGKLCHARGQARCDSAREVLRDAVRRIDGARTRAGRGDPESALSSWQGLISGRWSLVDRFEADGRRYVVALRNDPEVARPPGLSRREAQVAEYLALGHSEKEIAYTLGLSQSAISRRVSSAVRKLGLRSRAELAALASAFASGVAFREAELAGARLAIGSAPISASPAELSRAERQIAALASRGRSDAEIASERGASRRTVENQLHHIYRKLGVHSRAELAARLSA